MKKNNIKKKYLKLFQLLILVGIETYSQRIDVKYFHNAIVNSEKLKTLSQYHKTSSLKNTFSYLLQYQNGISFYQNEDFSKTGLKEKEYFEYQEEIVTEDGDGNKTILLGTQVDNFDLFKLKEMFYYKKLNENLILCQLYDGNQHYQIKDQLFDWNWEIKEEFKMVSGYKCRKAISRIMGYHFEAWYAEEIPVNAGPEKFDGLPGLILYVKSGNNEYIADYVKFIDSPIEIKKPEFQGDTFTFQEVFSGATKPSKK